MNLKNWINPFSLAKRINRPLILDGAMGSMLQQENIPVEHDMWMSLANIIRPEKVKKIHRDYIDAGADIITTNTFRTNPEAIKNHPKIQLKQIVKSAVDIAKDAADDLPVFIAGSNAPAEDCYQVERKIGIKEIEFNHIEHINALMENGCHFILNETQGHFDEIKIICEYCSKNEIPYVLSLFSFDGNNLLSGEPLAEAVKYIEDKNPLAVGFNCLMPDKFIKSINNFELNINWGTYLNCGSGNYEDENISCGIDPETYLSYVKNLLNYSPSFIGACCGSTPEHIKLIKNYFDGRIKS